MFGTSGSTFRRHDIAFVEFEMMDRLKLPGMLYRDLRYCLIHEDHLIKEVIFRIAVFKNFFLNLFGCFES